MESSGPDWIWWGIGVLVAGGFVWFFWWIGSEMLGRLRKLIKFVENWPRMRRAMVEDEARKGGRYPLWFRAARVTILLALVGLVIVIVWRRFG